MIPKILEQVEISDINSIFQAHDRETKTLEFKAKLDISNKENKLKFLATLSSFANANGGDVIYGVDESQGLVGFEVDNLDQLILQAEQSIRANIAPRIAYQIKEFKQAQDKYVIIFRITKSFDPPHMINLGGKNKFYSRGEAGKYELSITQIKDLVIGANSTKDKISNFIDGRIADILSDNGPIAISKGPKIILHLIPVNNFHNQNQLDLSTLKRLPNIKNFKPIDGYSIKAPRINFEGLLTFNNQWNLETDGYLQVFHNGTIESVNTSILHHQIGEELFVPSTIFKDKFLLGFSNHLKLLEALSVDFPLLVSLNIFGLKGYQLALRGGRANFTDSIVLRRNHLKFPEIIIEKKTSVESIIESYLRQFWNAFGHEY